MLKKPLDYLENPHNYLYGTIKLNSKFYNETDLRHFTNLWEHAKIRTSTDGATNILFEQVESSRSTFLPTFFSGDFDSIAPSVKKFFEEKNVEVMHTPDQDETDFTKNLQILLKKAEASNLKLDFVAVHEGSSIERFDHKLANINTLFKFSKTSDVFIFLIAGDGLTFLLNPGSHKINVESSLRGDWCSLAPIGSPCSISTEGFLYDMTNVKMEFGGLVSTSNSFSDTAPVVLIKNESPVLFSMGLKM